MSASESAHQADVQALKDAAKAYEAADDELQRKLNAIQLTPGPAGPTGAPGKDGKDGNDGAKGERGAVGAKGAHGSAGAKGAKGATGNDGAAGAAGAPGAKGAKGEQGEKGVAAVTGPRWVKILDNAQFHGKHDPSPYTPLVTGRFTKIRAVYRSGCVACNNGYRYNAWQCCQHPSHGGGPGFELKLNNNYVLEQKSWSVLPSECSMPADNKLTGDITCNKALTVTKFDKLTPTWYEASHGTSTSDNGHTVYLDLYVYGEPDEQNKWVQLLDNAYYHGASEPSPFQPMAYGTFKRFVAIWRSGCVACNNGFRYEAWQCCQNPAHGGSPSFELKKNGHYLVEQSSWSGLPKQCSITHLPNGNINCDVGFSLNHGDSLQPTWYEPSHRTSTSDNGNTVYFDLWAEPRD